MPPGSDGTQVVRVLQVARRQLDAVVALDGAERERQFPHLYASPVVDWRAPLHPDRPVPPDPEPGVDVNTGPGERP